MKAETALNVIEALSESELKRLHSMLGITKEPKAPKKKLLITEAQAIEYILNLYKKNPAGTGLNKSLI